MYFRDTASCPVLCRSSNRFGLLLGCPGATLKLLLAALGRPEAALSRWSRSWPLLHRSEALPAGLNQLSAALGLLLATFEPLSTMVFIERKKDNENQ